MNLVLADTEEFRATKKSLAAASNDTSIASNTIKEVKRAIGLIILRGETIVSVSVEAPPPSDHRAQAATSTPTNNNASAPQGTARPITRAPLSGPVRTSAAAPSAFFGGSTPGAPPPGFHPPPGFGGSR